MINKRFSIFLFTLSILILLYIIYKSEIYWLGSHREYYVYYYLGSFFLLLFSLISFNFNFKTQIYLIRILIIAAFLAYLSEFFLYSSKKFNFYGYKIQIPTKKLNERNKLYLTNIENNKNLSMVYANDLFLQNKNKKIFPLSGVAEKETIFCKNEKKFSSFYSDRYGFNNPDFVWDQEYVDILLVGDMVALGACEDRPNDLASQLRLFKKKVISIGYHGNESIMMLGSLKEYMPKNTKNVFWIYYEGNDTDEIEDELQDNILSKYFYNKDFSQNLKNKQKKINTFIEKANYDLHIKNQYDIKLELKKTFSGLFNFIKLSNLRYLIINKKMDEKKIPLPHPKFNEVISKAVEFTSENNANFYFIYLPEYKRFNTKTNLEEYKKIKLMINNLGVRFIDINHEIFNQTSEPKNLYSQSNYKIFNKFAYEIIAKKLVEHLVYTHPNYFTKVSPLLPLTSH